MAAPLAVSNIAGSDAAKLGAPAAKAQKRTVEQTYQKLTQLEHILLRPDTYIGSVEAVTQQGWVFDRDAKRMQPRSLTFVPGLYKIFDEIMVNAADNKQRDASMDTVRVDIDRAKGSISVFNNGRGLPVEIHKEHDCYVPELVFGQLLTSSNYDDDEAKVTGGRNGYGAKLANIFSKEFVVETSDIKTGLQFKQTFSNNMRERSKPTIKPTTKADWTRITFTPDLAKFGMTCLDDDICALMSRRVVDLAGCTDKSVKIYLDGERVPVSDFKSYVDLYIGTKGAEGAKPRVYEKVSDRWEVCVAPSDDGFTQVSFVNSIATTKGGKHVDHVTDQLVAKLMEVLKKKDKSAAALKPHAIKGHLTVFINCLIVNPAFDSQTKENMTLVQSKFGSKCELDDKFLKGMIGCGIVESILSFLTTKNQKDLAKTNKGKRERLTGISKLDDANEAGGRNSRKCTLILTEGDSAKALAVSGLSVIGRDYYGVFPLRGKLLNVRDAAIKQVSENAEITHIKQIMGLQHGKKYDNDAALNTLRYGHLMIMTDQDHDGSHIKGLVINWLHYYWPELLQFEGFLQEFVTPIVKATKGKQERAFFTLPEYDAWREAQPSLRSWTIKYYKGLGTSTSNEAKEYFSDLPKHELSFEWQGPHDSELIELAFSKKKADERKVWLQGYVQGTHVDHSQKTLPYDDFINKVRARERARRARGAHGARADCLRASCLADVPARVPRPPFASRPWTTCPRSRSRRSSSSSRARTTCARSRPSSTASSRASARSSSAASSASSRARSRSRSFRATSASTRPTTTARPRCRARSSTWRRTTLAPTTSTCSTRPASLARGCRAARTTRRRVTSSPSSARLRAPSSPRPTTRSSSTSRTTASRSSRPFTCPSCRWCSSTAPTASAPAGRRRCPTTTRSRSSPTCAA